MMEYSKKSAEISLNFWINLRKNLKMKLIDLQRDIAVIFN